MSDTKFIRKSRDLTVIPHPVVLAEGLQYLDMEGQVVPEITIDEYEAKMGDNDEIVTITFLVNGKEQGIDLEDWFERGYDWVLDAQTSDGEYTTGKYLVFVEIPRRSTTPQRIEELVTDLETLTGLEAKDWRIKLDHKNYVPLDEENIKKLITLSPHEYREEHEGDLNEWRQLSGMHTKPLFDSAEQDSELKHFKSLAGL